MKIITWNCNMAFRRKADFILTYQPDILFVPECEHPQKLLFPIGTPKPADTLWFGKNQNKGLAIFSFSSYRFTVLDNYNDRFEMIIPIAVTEARLTLISLQSELTIQPIQMENTLNKFGKRFITMTFCWDPPPVH